MKKYYKTGAYIRLLKIIADHSGEFPDIAALINKVSYEKEVKMYNTHIELPEEYEYVFNGGFDGYPANDIDDTVRDIAYGILYELFYREE